MVFGQDVRPYTDKKHLTEKKMSATSCNNNDLKLTGFGPSTALAELAISNMFEPGQVSQIGCFCKFQLHISLGISRSMHVR